MISFFKKKRPAPTKEQVYAKAAEVLLRDGQCKGELFEPPRDWSRRDKQSLLEVAGAGGPVCAIGACIRAERELYGDLSDETFRDPYSVYEFKAHDERRGRERKIYMINDDEDSTPEEVADLLRRRAAGEFAE